MTHLLTTNTNLTNGKVTERRCKGPLPQKKLLSLLLGKSPDTIFSANSNNPMPNYFSLKPLSFFFTSTFSLLLSQFGIIKLQHHY